MPGSETTSANSLTYEDLLNVCKAPDRKECMKSLTKEMIADILTNGAPSANPQDATVSHLHGWMEKINAELGELRDTNNRIAATLERMEQMEQQISELKEENASLKDEQKKQGEIIRQQQVFLERLDQKERANNLILVGVQEGGEPDEAMVRNIVRSLGLESTQTNVITGVKRIGEARGGKPRTMLVSVQSSKLRNEIVNAARSNTDLGNIRIKKDTSPAVRNEWGRLFRVKEEEEKRPENAGKVIAIDTRKRQVICDGQVIDSWKPLF